MPFERIIICRHLLSVMVLLSSMVLAEETPVFDNNVSKGAFYIAIEPTLISHCKHANSMAYIKSDVSVRVNNSEAQTFVNLHQPLIRDLLLTNFSLVSVEALTTIDQKEQFQDELLAIIKKELISEGEQAEAIEDILFTSFSIYR